MSVATLVVEIRPSVRAVKVVVAEIVEPNARCLNQAKSQRTPVISIPDISIYYCYKHTLFGPAIPNCD